MSSPHSSCHPLWLILFNNGISASHLTDYLREIESPCGSAILRLLFPPHLSLNSAPMQRFRVGSLIAIEFQRHWSFGNSCVFCLQQSSAITDEEIILYTSTSGHAGSFKEARMVSGCLCGIDRCLGCLLRIQPFFYHVVEWSHCKPGTSCLLHCC